MSNRVHGWIKRNAHLADVIYSTDLGGDVGRFVTKTAPGAVIAVPDLSAVPGPVIDGIAASGASVIDGTALLARLRASADPSDLALLFKAASIAHAALATARANETDAGALIAAIDGEARRLRRGRSLYRHRAGPWPQPRAVSSGRRSHARRDASPCARRSPTRARGCA